MSASFAKPLPRALYEAEGDYVWHCLRRLGVPASDLADQTQEVFMAAFASLERYDPSRPVRPWLFGLTVNVANHFRRQPRHRREVVGELPETRDDQQGPDEAAAIAQRQRRLREALDALDPSKRALVILHEFDGQPIPQIAETLGIPLNTAYSRLRLARAELADAFVRSGGGDS